MEMETKKRIGSWVRFTLLVALIVYCMFGTLVIMKADNIKTMNKIDDIYYELITTRNYANMNAKTLNMLVEIVGE